MSNLTRLFEIPLNVDNISQEILNVENRNRTSNFAWKGQFSPQFIEAMLRHYGKGKQRVLDPFSGSGTVLYEASLIGMEAVGVELNPSAYYMSKFYELGNLTKLEQDKIILEIQATIDNLLLEEDLLDLTKKISSMKGIKKDIFSLIVILTNVKKGEMIQLNDFLKSWLMVKSNFLNLVEGSNIRVYNSDFRNSKLQTRKFDLILTSPPYINVFNYHENYRQSAEILGFNILEVAKSEVGANRKNRGNRFLTVIQYLIDMSLIISELLRVASFDAKIIFIVGRLSKVLGVEFYNSELIVRIFEDIFSQKVSQRQERKFKNRFGQQIVEDILHIDFVDFPKLDESEVVQKAREIAYGELTSIELSSVQDKNVELLKQAINKINFVEPSKIMGEEYV